MKCHYEVLGLATDANDEELKKSYRKLALKWHPDKNMTNQEVAKEQFQLIQQAYDILSDPQERSWYDRHRDAILKGGLGDNYQDNSLDVFPYFTTTCFKGYNDDPLGFYSVYREVFNKLTTEDLEFADDPEMKIPVFGDSTSDYETIVHPFYAFWSSYTTKKTYSWLDPYDIRDTPNRRVLRLVEKENKKIREKAKKERNEEVRNLVAFVRKRDRRVHAWSKLLEVKAAENAKRAEERRQKTLKEKQENLKHYKEEEWSKFSNIESELKVIEANLAKEFNDHSESDGDDESDDEDKPDDMFLADNMFYCQACNKVFKTDKSFSNHEKSKRHIDNVQILKASLIDEAEPDDDSEDGSAASDFEEIPMPSTTDDKDVEEPMTHSNLENGACSNLSDELLESSDSSESIENSKMKKSKKQLKKEKSKKRTIYLEDSDHEQNAEILTPDGVGKPEPVEEVDAPSKKLKGKKAKEARKQQKAGKSDFVLDANIASTSEETQVNGARNAEEKAVRRGGKSKKDRGGNGDVDDVDHCCVSCKAEFSSKNKLFDHLKKTGHSVYIPELGKQEEPSLDKVTKRRARKNRV